MSLPTPVRAPNRCRLHSMSAFEGNPNDICSDRVLLSLTQNGPIPRRGQKSAGSMPVFSIGPKCGVMSRCGIRQMPHGQNQGGRRNGGWRTTALARSLRAHSQPADLPADGLRSGDVAITIAASQRTDQQQHMYRLRKGAPHGRFIPRSW
jgi:hypothetical protein